MATKKKGKGKVSKKGIIFLVIIGLAALFLLSVYSFLSKTEVIESEIMVVEGWVDNYTLQTAANEFSVQENKYLITTGGPISGNSFLMVFNSELRFPVESQHSPDSSDYSLIEVKALGIGLNDVFPRFELAINDSVVDNATTIDEFTSFTFNVKINPKDIHSVSVIFVNDESNDVEDRNLAVESIKVNKMKYTPFVKGVSLNFKSGKEKKTTPVYYYFAERSAYFLERAGVDKSKVIAVPTPFVDRNRTYESAIHVKEFLSSRYPEIKKINVVTEGPHARRSLMMYRKAFGEGYEVGIIGVDNPALNSRNWFTSGRGIKQVFTQLGKYLYAQFIFYPFY